MKKLDALGIDKASLKKEHQDCVAMITAHVNSQLILLGVLSGRPKKPAKEFLLIIPKKLRRIVKVMCSDLYERFINGVKNVIGF